MSDHKFERQVRQKLGDLKLSPTPESWEKIENEIRERKRRTAPIFWLPLLLLGLSAGGYLILKPVITKEQLSENEKTIVAPVKPSAGNEHAPAEPALEPGVANDITSNNQSANNRSNTTILIRNNKSRRIGNTIYLNDAREIPFRKFPENISPEKPAAADQSEEDKQPTSGPEQDRREKKAELKPVTEAMQTPAAGPATPKEEKKKRNKKWSFGVLASAGASAISEGRFGNIGGAQVEDVQATPAVGGSRGQFFGGNVTTAAPPPPSELKPSITYSFGITVKREFSERLALSAGVNYLQMNTVTKVGYRMNNRQIVNNDLGYNVVNLYYLPSEDYINKYRNHYHFIEIPVTLHTRLNKSDKLPVYWNAGVSANILLNSSALHYDGTNGVYYNDDALLNPVQGGVSTGFSFALFNRSKKPLWIGPTARYHFSPILKKNVSASKNFMGLGLDVRWYLK